MKKVLSTMGSDNCHCANCGAYDICSTETFRFHLERERDRADRSQRPFSLVILGDASPGSRNARADWMIRYIQPRLRLADMAGWISAREIGVILFDTSYDGANVFLRHLLEGWPMDRPPPHHRIFTYPSSPLMEDEHQLWFDSLHSLRNDPEACRLFAKRHWHPSALGKSACLTAPEDEPQAPQSADEALHYLLAIQPPRWKRWLDVLLSSTALVVLSPLFLLIAVTIRASSPGPILFRQERVGYMGRTFFCLKFRTMHVNAGAHVHRDYVQGLIRSEIAMRKLDGRHDPRVYAFGRFLRATSLDELPQLINVLRGEMSLIGPRPCIPYEYERFLPWHRHRVDTLPGLTGLWQVSGKNKTTFAEMIRLDRTYARKKSFLLDILIVVWTIPVMLEQFLEDVKARKSHEHIRLTDRWKNALAISRNMAKEQQASEVHS
jgi:lipopolysaccharide/colanic/teichoic acid biosynthesis glycosyltransferase